MQLMMAYWLKVIVDGARREVKYFCVFSACQVLVVITDRKSGSNASDVKTAAKPLEEAGIAVIPVSIGFEADVKELENITPDKTNIIEPSAGTSSNELAKMIMEKINTGIIKKNFFSCVEWIS